MTTEKQILSCYYKICKCGVCAKCGHPRHAAVHLPCYGMPPDSKPWGHEFIAEELI